MTKLYSVWQQAYSKYKTLGDICISFTESDIDRVSAFDSDAKLFSEVIDQTFSWLMWPYSGLICT